MAPDKPPEDRFRRVDWYPWLLALCVLAARVLTRAELYFADGPSHIRAITGRVFVIQPPGYWLFNRLAGLFNDPVAAISIFNVVCSALGIVFFYHCALRLLADGSLARWGAAVYASLFYTWFSAEIHSTYASQLLFPAATYYYFLRNQETGRAGYMYVAGAIFAIGAGLRPSDGAFMLPFIGLQLLRSGKRSHMFAAAAIIAVLCLGWIIPTVVAYHRAGTRLEAVTSYAGYIASSRSVLAGGVKRENLANITRVFVALLFAFWPFALPLAFSGSAAAGLRVRELWLWIAPGLAFFVLGYFADAPYLNFATMPILLLCLSLLKGCNPRLGMATAGLCIVFNVAFFLGFKPIMRPGLLVNTINCYAGRFTNASLQHRSFPNLSDVVKDQTLLLRPTQ
jgi:hypothetical protein